MNRDAPKPFIRIGEKTILEHTISRFLGLDGLEQVIIATSEPYIDQTLESVRSLAGARIEVCCVAGGDERQHSIYNALQQVGACELVIIHDAVRPFVTSEQIERCCRKASAEGAAIVGVPAKDTIKKIDEQLRIRETPDRRHLWQAQTPQVFAKDLIMRAYRKAMEEGYVGTDDASLVERLGEPVVMVEGERSNFKITYPLDLKLAKLLLEE